MQDLVKISDIKLLKTSITRICKSCKCSDTEEAKKHCEEVVGKILKDRKLEAPEATCE